MSILTFMLQISKQKRGMLANIIVSISKTWRTLVWIKQGIFQSEKNGASLISSCSIELPKSVIERKVDTSVKAHRA